MQVEERGGVVDILEHAGGRLIDPRRGIDRDHPIPLALEILHHEVARPIPVGGGADHRSGLDALQNRAELRIGVGDGIEAAHACPAVAARAPPRMLQ